MQENNYDQITEPSSATRSHQAHDIIEQEILRYIDANPEFIPCHEKVLAQIAIKHEAGGATSLLERQVLTLRSRNMELSAQLHHNERQADDRLSQLVSIARDNEKQIKQFYQLAVHIIQKQQQAASKDEIIRSIEDFLRDQFGLTQVSLLLNSDIQQAAFDDQETTKQLADFMRYGVVSCGPLSSDITRVLATQVDTDQLAMIESAAVVPLRHAEEQRSGILLLGSDQLARFTADMGTNFLRELAKIITAAL